MKGSLRGDEKKIDPITRNEKDASRVATSPKGNYLLFFVSIFMEETIKKSCAQVSFTSVIYNVSYDHTPYLPNMYYSNCLVR